MYKIYAILTVFLIMPGIISANQTVDQKIAALEAGLTKASVKEKVDILIRLASHTFRHAPQKCIDYGRRALDLSRKLNYPQRTADALVYIGLGHYCGSGDHQKALSFFRQGLELFEKLGDRKKSAATLVKIGIVHKNTGDFDQALDYYRRAFQIFEDLNSQKEIAMVHNNIGNLYDDMGQYDKALSHYLESLKIKETFGDPIELAVAFTNIGTIYWRIKEYQQALEYFKAVLKIDRQSGNKSDISGSLHNMAMVFSSLGRHRKALDHYQQSLRLKEETGDRRGTAFTLVNIGEIYYAMEQYQQSLKYYSRALELMSDLNDQNGLAGTLGNIGAAYIRLHRYDEALPYLERCIDTAQAIDAPQLLNEHYLNLSELYEAKGNQKKALVYYKKFFEFGQKIFNDTSSREIARLRTRFETEKKEQKIRTLEQEKRIQELESRSKVTIILAVLLGLMLVLVVIYRSYRRYKHEAAGKEEKLLSLQRESRLKLFLAGIDKHFLFNSLDSIIGLDKIPTPVKENLKKLSSLYRYMLSTTDRLVIRLKEELAAVRDYLDIEKKMLKGRLYFDICEVDDRLLESRIMPQTVLTLVENAVKHGIYPHEQGGTVHIDIRKDNTSLIVAVTDSGIGIEPTPAYQAGFGLYSVQERLRLYYDNRAGFRIEALKNGGTRATMEVPYEESDRQ